MMFVSGINDVITKAIGQRLPPMEIMFFRFFFTFIKENNSFKKISSAALNVLAKRVEVCREDNACWENTLVIFAFAFCEKLFKPL